MLHIRLVMGDLACALMKSNIRTAQLGEFLGVRFLKECMFAMFAMLDIASTQIIFLSERRQTIYETL